jgi:hypothetical protein
MIGSFAGSLGLAAIGAEEDSTANLVPATLFLHVSVMLSVVVVLAAFEVLAALYLPESKTLLALITATAGLIGSLTTSFGCPMPGTAVLWMPSNGRSGSRLSGFGPIHKPMLGLIGL